MNLAIFLTAAVVAAHSGHSSLVSSWLISMRFLHDASLGFFARCLPLAAASAKSAVWNKRHVEGIRDLTWANFPKADLRGANIQDSKDYSNSAIFKNAKYDRSTRWPRGFDYESSGAVLVKQEDGK